MAHSEGMESHSGTVRLSLSLSLPVSGEPAGAGGGAGWEDLGELLGLRRPLAVDHWGEPEDSWTPEAGGDPRVDSNSGTVRLRVSLPVDRGITVDCGTVEAGGEAGMDGNPSAVGLGRPLAVVEVIRSAAVAGGGHGSVRSHSSVARPLVLTVESVSIWSKIK